MSTDLTVDECKRAEALWAQLGDAASAAVPEYGGLTYAEDLREAQRRSGLASLAGEADLPEDQRRLLQRWQTEVQIPALVLAGLLDELANAADEAEVQAVLDKAERRWEQAIISAADYMALCLLAEE